MRPICGDITKTLEQEQYEKYLRVVSVADIMKKTKEIKKNRAESIMNDDDWSIPCGQVRRRVGDVFMYGRDKYIVEVVSPSRAVARCLSRRRQTVIVDDLAQRIEPESAPTTISISSCCDRQDVIDHKEGYQSSLLSSLSPT